MKGSIYIEKISGDADKPGLVMLHGWAMHSGLMKQLAEQLSEQFNIYLVDLPGHGLSKLSGATFDITAIANDVYAALSEMLKGKTNWLGWSLGGLVAMKIAELFPDSVNKLLLLASTPAFVKQPGWQHAVEKQVFENFARELQNDPRSTISRFLSLQVRGAEDSRQTLKKLREMVFAKDIANQATLVEGLTILEQTDLRQVFNDLKVSSLLLGGERDTLVPQTALFELANNENVEASIIKKAGHAPFLSHPGQCAEEIIRFCHV